MSDIENEGDFILRVTNSRVFGWNVEFGLELDGLSYEEKLYIAGKMLVDLGTRLLTSTVDEEDEEDEY